MSGTPQENPREAIPSSEPQKTSASQEAVGAVTGEVTAALHAKVADVRNPNVQSNQLVIREGDFRELREQLINRPEVRDLSKIDARIVDERDKGYDASAADSVRRHIEGLKHVSHVFLVDAETELAMPNINLPKTRILMQQAYSYAKALSAGRHNNFEALDALKAWQVSIAKQHPEAVRQLIESYKKTIAAECAGQRPDLIFLKQWIDLCTGFAPDELATELAEQLHLAAEKRCKSFMAVVETELREPRPDFGKIQSNIIVPPKYYADLAPGSPIPDQVKALEERFAALLKK